VPAPAYESISSSAKPAPSILQIAERVNAHPYQVLPVWIIAYFVVFANPAMRPLWYDELTTLYIAKSPSLEHFFKCLTSVDLAPPLQFVLVKLSMLLFGESPWSVRLPGILGYLVGSLAVFHVVFKRFGGNVGLAILGIFWSIYPAVSALDARPYGLLVGFLGLGLLCWTQAIQTGEGRWTKWHTGLVASISGMFLTHCFSPFFAAALGVGELMRTYRTHRLDKRLWAAILLPLVWLPGYIPLIRNAQGVLFPQAFRTHALMPVLFYVVLILPILPIAITLAVVLFRRRKEPPKWHQLLESHELAFCAAGLMAPVVVIAYSVWSHVPFWLRYGAPACVAFAFIISPMLASVLRNTMASLMSALVILLLFCMVKAGSGELGGPVQTTTHWYRSIKPDLPFVTASGLCFVEMDYREPLDFKKRLHYLTDRESAVRIRHATLFEGLTQVKELFPITGSVSSYPEFVKTNRHFLLFATPDAPEDWLYIKLKEDGAKIELLHDELTAYRDHQVYEVTLR
jgi:4-amino-4-deoxy-L-arabinose transferase-like glycosyltransferase